MVIIINKYVFKMEKVWARHKKQVWGKGPVIRGGRSFGSIIPKCLKDLPPPSAGCKTKNSRIGPGFLIIKLFGVRSFIDGGEAPWLQSRHSSSPKHHHPAWSSQGCWQVIDSSKAVPSSLPLRVPPPLQMGNRLAQQCAVQDSEG